jgi:hypothetical protein
MLHNAELFLRGVLLLKWSRNAQAFLLKLIILTTTLGNSRNYEVLDFFAILLVLTFPKSKYSLQQSIANDLHTKVRYRTAFPKFYV